MSMPVSFVTSVLALALGLSLAPVAQAAPASPWLVRLGVSDVAPDSDHSRTLAGDVDVEHGLGMSFNVAYFITPQIAVDVLAAAPFKQDVAVNGSEVASVKHLPPVLSLQYHFAPEAAIRPYVGAGVNYTLFMDEQIRGADLRLKNSAGLAGQVGVDIPVTPRITLGADIRYIDIDSEARVNGTRIGTLHIDPLVCTLNVGYRF